MTCTGCQFYKVLDDNKPHCLRYPPILLGQITYFDGGQQRLQAIIDFPTLNRTDACGEWRLRGCSDEPV